MGKTDARVARTTSSSVVAGVIPSRGLVACAGRVGDPPVVPACPQPNPRRADRRSPGLQQSLGAVPAVCLAPNCGGHVVVQAGCIAVATANSEPKKMRGATILAFMNDYIIYSWTAIRSLYEQFCRCGTLSDLFGILV